MDDTGHGGSATLDDATSLRRTPHQRRSRERVERILNGAAALIAECGSHSLRMSDVARLAGVSIGSLYQYFPDKSAIIQTLAERYNAQGRDCIEAGLAHVHTIDDLCDAFGALIDEYYAMFLAEPVMRDIWSSSQADNALRDIELANSRKNGADLVKVLARLRPTVSKEELAASAFLIMHLGEATVRLAISGNRAEGDILIALYKRMAQTELHRVVGGTA